MARRRSEEQVEPQQLLEAAAHEFAQHGFEGARVDGIARRAQVNKAMLYYRIGDKAALYQAVMAHFFEPLVAELRQADEPRQAPRQRLRSLVATLVSHLEARPCCRSIMLREMASGGSNIPPAIFRSMVGVFELLTEILKQGVAVGAFRPIDPMLLHFSIFGALNWFLAARPARARAREQMPELGQYPEIEDQATLVDQFVGIISEGLLPRP